MLQECGDLGETLQAALAVDKHSRPVYACAIPAVMTAVMPLESARCALGTSYGGFFLDWLCRRTAVGAERFRSLRRKPGGLELRPSGTVRATQHDRSATWRPAGSGTCLTPWSGK